MNNPTLNALVDDWRAQLARNAVHAYAAWIAAQAEADEARLRYAQAYGKCCAAQGVGVTTIPRLPHPDDSLEAF